MLLLRVVTHSESERVRVRVRVCGIRGPLSIPDPHPCGWQVLPGQGPLQIVLLLFVFAHAPPPEALHPLGLQQGRTRTPTVGSYRGLVSDERGTPSPRCSLLARERVGGPHSLNSNSQTGAPRAGPAAGGPDPLRVHPCAHAAPPHGERETERETERQTERQTEREKSRTSVYRSNGGFLILVIVRE